MKFNKSTYIAILFSGLFLQSCVSVKDYHRPIEVENAAHYRTDVLAKDLAAKDSLSLANFSYTEVFKDEKLQNLIYNGLQNNIDIRVALNNIATSEAYLKQAKSAYFPSIGVNPSVRTNTNPVSPAYNNSDRTWNTQYNIEANSTWELDIWGKLKSSEKAQYATYLQTMAAHKAVKSNIVNGIASAYFQLLALDEQYNTTQESIALQKESVETTKALKKAGQVTEVAVQQTEALLFNYQSRLISIANSIKIAENQICYLMGENPHPIERTSIDQQFIPDEVQVGYPVDLLRNRPDVLAAEQRLVAAFQEVQVARLNMYPSLNISLSGGTQAMDIENLLDVNHLFAQIVGGITQPIFQQRRLRTQKEVKEIAQETALLNFKETLLAASQEVSNVLQIYDSQDEIIQLKTKEYQNYNRAIDYSQELLNYGMANYLEVITAQQNALNAKLQQINAKHTKLNALVDLYSALGGGWK